MKKNRILGIVGIGPRGLYALENLVSNLTDSDSFDKIHLLLFEETGMFGNGPVYDIEQIKTNWLNISERILILNSRSEMKYKDIHIPAFPSYHEWINIDFSLIPKKQADHYPPRKKLGEYLKQRFETFIKPLKKAKHVSLIKECVKDVDFMDDGKIKLITNSKSYNNIDEVLLTIGHQSTELSKQLSKWDKYSKNNANVNFFKNPYPVEDCLNCKDLNSKSSIGIRGFGLSMIDVARGIANKFGDFKIVDEKTMAVKYFTADDSAFKFVPFSLDGLPLSPKPLNAQIDKKFKPTVKQLSDFKSIIGNTSIQRKAKSPLFLIKAIAPIAAHVFSRLPQTTLKNKLNIKKTERVIRQWLKNESYEHEAITFQKKSAEKLMYEFAGMATDTENVSLDYCIGQVWRHCQPSIYEQLSFNECNEEVFAEIINLDERMKRYSYGPPVESLQQMLALVSAGVMTFEFLKDPDISLTKKGWRVKSNGKSHTVDIMINSVLDPAEIKSVNSPLVKNLLSKELVKVVHDDLGVLTDENGYLIVKGNDVIIPIALLGRLAKGTIIGVDAILECFGIRPEKWACEASNRHINWLKKK